MTPRSPIIQPDHKDSGGDGKTVIREADHPIREHHLDLEALKVLYRLRDAGFKGYLVGGGVRDLYLGRRPKDFDISTDARPGQLRKLFRNSRTIGKRFRLVQVFFRGNKIIEVSTLRSQSEYDIKDSDQVLPSNNTFGTLEEDAFRRDLTINSLFYEIESNTIIDYVGGVDDLQQGIIRIVGDPNRRFTRDPVRMMRAVRHAARTGFSIDSETLSAIKEHGNKLNLCPPSRIRDEVLKDLKAGACCPWAELCIEASLWQSLFPLYTIYLKGNNGEQLSAELLKVLAVLDRIHNSAEGNNHVKIPEHMLFAALLLPWACKRYNLPATKVRGPGYHRLSRKIRMDLDQHFGEQFNVKRMAKEAITTLFVNLPTLHEFKLTGRTPKWLKKKSYYADCSRFYELYLEAQGDKEVCIDHFVELKPEQETAPVQRSSGAGRGARGRGGVNPAFSTKKNGVFGLRRQHDS